MSILFVVGTPIGNLSDVSQRVLETFSQCDFVICEDTRVTGFLLSHFQIKKPLESYHINNEHKKSDFLTDRILAGSTAVLVSDAGMPSVSDPGFLLVRLAHQKGIKVVVIPGPSAAITALVASGLPSDRFCFEGFLPHKKGRQTKLVELSEETRTLVLFESNHRIAKLLREMVPFFGEDRLVAVCRELTKKFEEVRRGPLSEIFADFEARDKIQGEIVVVIAGKGYSE